MSSLLYLGEMMLLLGDPLKIIGIGDEIGDLLHLLYRLKQQQLPAKLTTITN